MSAVYLFDWGDTLMVDFPEQSGKMCEWAIVEAVNGAHEALKQLSTVSKIYVATNAADSSESDIKSAFERVGLSQYISGYFCKANLSIGKGTPEFFNKIIKVLGVDPQSVVMVGDTYSKDIEPAITAGIRAIWFNPTKQSISAHHNIRQISHLVEICT
ncbi:HAD family hydrolase [Vibrio vulnificus]|nr:HAD family hydrolase [Vibrio vulnificus]